MKIEENMQWSVQTSLSGWNGERKLSEKRATFNTCRPAIKMICSLWYIWLGLCFDAENFSFFQTDRWKEVFISCIYPWVGDSQIWKSATWPSRCEWRQCAVCTRTAWTLVEIGARSPASWNTVSERLFWLRFLAWPRIIAVTDHGKKKEDEKEQQDSLREKKKSPFTVTADP